MHTQSEVMTVRRAIEALAYLWLILVTALLAIEIVAIVGEPLPPGFDGLVDPRPVRIIFVAVVWLVAVLLTAPGLLEMRVSPQSHGPVWWLVVVMAAFGYMLVTVPTYQRAASRICGGATSLAAMAMLFLDIIEPFRTLQRRAARSPDR
jgi:hypothetical protein